MKAEIKNEVSLADLKQLGKQGGATAHLDDGTLVTLRQQHGTIRARGYVGGILQDVEVAIPYTSLYAQIRTIKQHGVLVARKVKEGHLFKLILTGSGYYRPRK